eukprot:m.16362 g.16362  ORF g.16362 m.16362 type:complete len:403 (-) comp6879_c0_seq1:180-1388(-)
MARTILPPPSAKECFSVLNCHHARARWPRALVCWVAGDRSGLGGGSGRSIRGRDRGSSRGRDCHAALTQHLHPCMHSLGSKIAEGVVKAHHVAASLLTVKGTALWNLVTLDAGRGHNRFQGLSLLSEHTKSNVVCGREKVPCQDLIGCGDVDVDVNELPGTKLVCGVAVGGETFTQIPLARDLAAPKLGCVTRVAGVGTGTSEHRRQLTRRDLGKQRLLVARGTHDKLLASVLVHQTTDKRKDIWKNAGWVDDKDPPQNLGVVLFQHLEHLARQLEVGAVDGAKSKAVKVDDKCDAIDALTGFLAGLLAAAECILHHVGRAILEQLTATRRPQQATRVNMCRAFVADWIALLVVAPPAKSKVLIHHLAWLELLQHRVRAHPAAPLQMAPEHLLRRLQIVLAG